MVMYLQLYCYACLDLCWYFVLVLRVGTCAGSCIGTSPVVWSIVGIQRCISTCLCAFIWFGIENHTWTGFRIGTCIGTCTCVGTCDGTGIRMWIGFLPKALTFGQTPPHPKLDTRPET